jgi:hypothetical protein
VDTFEPYPHSPGHPALATLEFRHAALHIYGNAVIARPHVCRATFSETFPQVPGDEEQSGKRVIAVLRELFADGIAHILTLCPLIKAAERFRHPRAEQERRALQTPSFDNYLDEIRQELPKGLELGRFDSLSLPSLLREFSLLVLNPLGPRSEADRAYGIGPKETQVGDIMIPLWYPGWDSDDHYILPGEESTACKAMTMLVVRPTGVECFQHEITVSDKRERLGVPKARVVGPALCVFPGALLGDHGLTDVRWAGNLDKGRRCFACLV